MIDFASIFYLCLVGIQKKALIIFLNLKKIQALLSTSHSILHDSLKSIKKYTVWRLKYL